MRVTWNDLLRPGDASDFFARDPLPAFEPAARHFSAANAWWLAELSRLVYRRDRPETAAPLAPFRSELARRAGLEEVGFARSDETGSAALIVRGHAPSPFAVLVFRGTEQEIQDFLCDAQTWPVPAFGATTRVHGGFKRALNSIWTPLARVLDSLDCPVFYTGHSLGAALATLAAVRRAPHAVYAYGSPRVGNAQFVEKLQHLPVFRIVHGNDVVTTVPPEALGFRHAGEERRLGERASTSLPAFDAKKMWSQLTTPVGPLADHAPMRYVRFCAAGLEKK
jgi:triacylglycerol lipase